MSKEDDIRVHQTILNRAIDRLDVRINRLLKARARLETLRIKPPVTDDKNEREDHE